MLRLLVIAGLLVMAGLMLWIRLAPTDPAAWHVDPGTAPDPGRRGVLTTATFAAEPANVLTAFDAVALQTPRVTRLTGDPAEAFVTYEARSLIWGFPDIVTAKAEPGDTGGTRLVILSRARFGGYDHGVNASRIETWLANVEARLGS